MRSVPGDLSCQHLCQPNGRCSSWLEMTKVPTWEGRVVAESVLDRLEELGKARCKLAAIYFL